MLYMRKFVGGESGIEYSLYHGIRRDDGIPSFSAELVAIYLVNLRK